MIKILLRLAAQSAWSRKAGLLFLLLSIATSTCLLLGIELARQSAKSSFSNAVAGTDLIVGAQSSPVSLLLYSVFRIGEAARDMPYSAFERLKNDPRVKFALPIALGDSYQGFPVVGTTAVYFDKFRYGAGHALEFQQGRAFEDYQIGKSGKVLFDAVLGSEVAKFLKKSLGDKIALTHGLQVQQGEASHADKPFTVVGILKPTGTPVDRSVHLGLNGLQAIHIDWAAGLPIAEAQIPADLVTKFDLTPKSITATLLALNNRTAVFGMKRELESQSDVALTAILPGVALSTLWQTLGLFEQVLLFVAVLVAFVSVLGLASVMLVALGQRRRELAVLRSVGAGPAMVFGLLCLESTLLMFLGVTIGVLTVSMGVGFLGPLVQAQFGFQLSPLHDLKTGFTALFVFFFFGSALGAIPAWQAYRNQLQDGLNPRLN